MVGPVYDDIEKWRHVFPEDLFEEQFEKLSRIWKEGLELLELAYKDKPLSDDDALLLDCARICCYHFASTYNHIKFVRNRESTELLLSLLNDEERLALLEAEILGRNPTVGYESSNHYFFTRTDLVEKVIICRHLREKLKNK